VVSLTIRVPIRVVKKPQKPPVFSIRVVFLKKMVAEH
jgi:hypothetical protein